jgi:hypothetical protein
MPENSTDGLRRKLDCAVITLLHRMRTDSGETDGSTRVKGVFLEGGPIYAGSGLSEKTHAQICVCDPDCIKGTFRVQPRFLA